MKRNLCWTTICAAALLFLSTGKASAQVVTDGVTTYPLTAYPYATYYPYGTNYVYPGYGYYGARRYGYGYGYGYGAYGRASVANRAYFGATRTGYGGTYRTGYGSSYRTGYRAGYRTGYRGGRR